MRMVQCVVLKQEAEGLDKPPHPGELGQRIFQQVSKQGWTQWLQRLAIIINENQINTADPQSLPIIEAHMKGFLFGEGDLGNLPSGFRPPGAKK